MSRLASRPSRTTAANLGTYGIRDWVGTRGDIWTLWGRNKYIASLEFEPRTQPSRYTDKRRSRVMKKETGVTCSHRSFIY